jgi:large repetitive protein
LYGGAPDGEESLRRRGRRHTIAQDLHHPVAQHRLGLRRLPRYAHGLIAATAVTLALAAPAAAQPTCGQTITQDTTLTADLRCSSEFAPALTIGAPGITLDLGGHTISIGDVAIVNYGYDDVTIRNGTILSFQESIHLEGVSRNVIRDIDTNGLIIGITVVDSDHNRFVNNRVTSISFSLTRSDHNVIAHNAITKYESSLGLSDSNYNRVVDNVVWGDFGGGFHMGGGSHHNEVRRNKFIGNTFLVVSLTGANDNELTDNTIASVGGDQAAGDVQIEDSSRNLIARNTLFGGQQGFNLRSGSDNTFRRNDVAGVPFTGSRYGYPELAPEGLFVAAPATGTLLQANKVRGFSDDGIDVDAPGTRLKGNTANDNGDLGIEAVPGIIDLGGNSASGNGNPLQCLNVVC